VAAADSQPFYYSSDGTPLYLVPDPTEIVFTASSLAAVDAVPGMVSRLNLSTTAPEALPQLADHWLLRLPATTPIAAALALRANLKADGRFGFVSMAYRQVGDTSRILLVDRAVVRFRPEVTATQIDSLVSALRMKIIRPPRPDSGFAAYWLGYPTDSGADPLKLSALLFKHPLVAWAQPDKIGDGHVQSVPTDPYFPLQYYLKNTNVQNGITIDDDVEPAWDLTLGGGTPSEGGITIAIIDDGVEASHPDFQELGSSRVEFGYDVFGNDTLDCVGCANNPTVQQHHGTAVAGIAAAEQNNGQGISGVAPEAHVLPIRIFAFNTRISQDVIATDAEIADGINFAAGLGRADVLSNSWNFPPGYDSPAIDNAINSAVSGGRGGLGALVVFSGGNTSTHTLLYPATRANVVAVGAIGRTGTQADYSPNNPTLVALSAQHSSTDFCHGGDVVTTDLAGHSACNNGPNGDPNYITTFGGTSAAAPQVAGVAALVLSLHPTMTVTQLRGRIVASVDPWGSSTQFGAGKLNAYRAVAFLSASVSGPAFIDSPGLYTWTASASGGNGPFTYQWQESVNGGSSWFPVGTNSTTYSENETASSTFELRVMVSSGGLQAPSQPLFITVQIGGCGPRGC